jgi:fibro-slime domain-containing protein
MLRFVTGGNVKTPTTSTTRCDSSLRMHPLKCHLFSKDDENFGCPPNNNNPPKKGICHDNIDLSNDDDDKPRFKSPGSDNLHCLSDGDHFRRWFRHEDGDYNNLTTMLTAIDGNFHDDDYFPGNSFDRSSGLNYYACDLHFCFSYKGGEKVHFKTSLDLWLFIDKKLVIDLGGIHGVVEETLNIDALNLARNTTHRFDLFIAHRHTDKAIFELNHTLCRTSCRIKDGSIPVHHSPPSCSPVCISDDDCPQTGFCDNATHQCRLKVCTAPGNADCGGSQTCPIGNNCVANHHICECQPFCNSALGPGGACPDCFPCSGQECQIFSECSPDFETCDNVPLPCDPYHGDCSSLPQCPPCTNSPTNFPTPFPTSAPSNAPTVAPSNAPTNAPTAVTGAPSNAPTTASNAPSNAPTVAPSNAPTVAPSNAPTVAPSNAPTVAPSNAPTVAPSNAPTVAPSNAPTVAPSNAPTVAPSNAPTTIAPVGTPTNAPTPPTGAPTKSPTAATGTPTNSPTGAPTKSPTAATGAPTKSPTGAPTNTPPPTQACHFCTYSQGGYGSNCQGQNARDNCSTLMSEWNSNNPPPGGCLRDKCFNGTITLGNSSFGGKTATFTSATAIHNFLPAGGSAGLFVQTYTNPTSTSAGVFAGQLLSAMLSVRFAPPGSANFATLRFVDCNLSSNIIGLSILDVIYIANQVIANQTGAGAPNYSQYSPSSLSDALALFNTNFEGCGNKNPQCFTCGNASGNSSTIPPTHWNPPTPTTTSAPPTQIEQCKCCSFTQGGYGSTCPVNNPQNGESCAQLVGMWGSAQPGCLLDACFVGPITLGNASAGGHTARFDTASNIRAFLPNGGTPGVFAQSYVNPTGNPFGTTAGVFAAQLLTAKLNVLLGNATCNASNLFFLNCSDVDGNLTGKSLADAIWLADQIIGNQPGFNYHPFTAQGMSNSLDVYNNAFEGCTNKRPDCFICRPPTHAPTQVYIHIHTYLYLHYIGTYAYCLSYSRTYKCPNRRSYKCSYACTYVYSNRRSYSYSLSYSRTYDYSNRRTNAYCLSYTRTDNYPNRRSYSYCLSYTRTNNYSNRRTYAYCLSYSRTYEYPNRSPYPHSLSYSYTYYRSNWRSDSHSLSYSCSYECSDGCSYSHRLPYPYTYEPSNRSSYWCTNPCCLSYTCPYECANWSTNSGIYCIPFFPNILTV